jgi:hypothetical protein
VKTLVFIIQEQSRNLFSAFLLALGGCLARLLAAQSTYDYATCKITTTL